MNQERVFSVLLGPHVSEKSAVATEKANQYAFRVARDATKPEIKTAVEQLFKVKVANVRVLNVKGKVKQNRFGAAKRSDWKKAYVRLETGQDIDFTVIEEDGKQGLLIMTKKREKSVNTLDLGLELIGAVQKENTFRVVARYTADNLKSLGAEWKNELWLGQNSRIFTEFYQNPFSSTSSIFKARSATFRVTTPFALTSA